MSEQDKHMKYSFEHASIGQVIINENGQIMINSEGVRTLADDLESLKAKIIDPEVVSAVDAAIVEVKQNRLSKALDALKPVAGFLTGVLRSVGSSILVEFMKKGGIWPA